MSNNSHVLTWAGQALMILYFINVIFIGYIGYKDIALVMYVYGNVILIGLAGMFLVFIGGAIENTSTIIKKICILGSFFAFFVCAYLVNALI